MFVISKGINGETALPHFSILVLNVHRVSLFLFTSTLLLDAVCLVKSSLRIRHQILVHHTQKFVLIKYM